MLAVAIGALGAGSDKWGLSTWSVFALSWAILPFLYRRVGIGIWSYEVEQLAMWSGWVAGTMAVGIEDQGDYPGSWLAIAFLLCSDVPSSERSCCDMAFARRFAFDAIVMGESGN